MGVTELCVFVVCVCGVNEGCVGNQAMGVGERKEGWGQGNDEVVRDCGLFMFRATPWYFDDVGIGMTKLKCHDPSQLYSYTQYRAIRYLICGLGRVLVS